MFPEIDRKTGEAKPLSPICDPRRSDSNSSQFLRSRRGGFGALPPWEFPRAILFWPLGAKCTCIVWQMIIPRLSKVGLLEYNGYDNIFPCIIWNSHIIIWNSSIFFWEYNGKMIPWSGKWSLFWNDLPIVFRIFPWTTGRLSEFSFVESFPRLFPVGLLKTLPSTSVRAYKVCLIFGCSS